MLTFAFLFAATFNAAAQGIITTIAGTDTVFTYDGQRQQLPNFLDPPNFFAQPANIKALLAPKLNTYQINRNQDVLMVKSDISLSKNNQLSLRLNHQNFTGKNNEFTGTLGTEEHSGDSIAKTGSRSGKPKFGSNDDWMSPASTPARPESRPDRIHV